MLVRDPANRVTFEIFEWQRQKRACDYQTTPSTATFNARYFRACLQGEGTFSVLVSYPDRWVKDSSVLKAR